MEYTNIGLLKIPKNYVKIDLNVNAFKDMQYIPAKYTCDGDDINFEIEFSSNFKYHIIFIQDPDAPIGVFGHWVIYNIKNVRKIPEGIEKNKIIYIDNEEIYQGINDFREIGYNGPCPPRGNPHRYILTILGFDKILNLEPGLYWKDVIKRINPDDIKGLGIITGLYKH